MLQRCKVVVLSTIIVLVLGTVVFWLSPLHPSGAKSASFRQIHHNPFANGPYTVQGNTILGADSQPYIFHGIGRDSLEYSCDGDGHLTSQELAYMGSGSNTANATYWGANTVRLPLSENIWLNGEPTSTPSCTASQYQTVVQQTVDALTALKLNVIIDLQWADAGGQLSAGGGPSAMPDADSVTFWQQVATTYQSYSNVLFELYNEPHPPQWSCWAAACTMTNDPVYADDCHCTKIVTYNSVGMQGLVDAVRGTGAKNLVLVAGMNWGYDLSQIAQYPITGSNVAYDTHPYPYSNKQPNSWDAAFGTISATYPVISTESGEYDCGTSYMSQLLSYFDAHNIGWVGWAWVVKGDICGYPQLVQDYRGTPAVSMGQFIYRHMRSYLSVAPVSKAWYFAEGRVGGNFKEYLTLSNPDPNNTCAVNIQYLKENGANVTQRVTVGTTSRVTRSVNSDLNVPVQNPGMSVSAVVTVDSTTTPNCVGVIAERPMYFNWHGITSGSDVLGATQTGTVFNFADVPVGGGFTSFITILNPGATTANVVAKYYANGTQFTQNLAVPAGSRGTIVPGSMVPALPQHVAAMVTSDQRVLVERPDYFSNINGGNAGVVSGSTCVVGVSQLANDWLFAEGYTGGHFQETLVIANIDTVANAPASVSINLKYTNGAIHSYAVTVNPMSQLIWNVNTQGAGGTSQEVSAEVTSTGAKIIVEREMYFQYAHTVNGKVTTARGGTDVIGEVGPAYLNAFAFAEGYTNTGYNEWLTIQNPTNVQETVHLTLVNGYARSYTQTVVVGANSRTTVDITALVAQKLVLPGDSYHAYEVSMTVTGGSPFVAERPMYWNTGVWSGSSTGTQGGSDVIGFTG